MQIPGWQKLISLVRPETSEKTWGSKNSDQARAAASTASENCLVQRQAAEIKALKAQVMAADERADNYATRLRTAGLMVEPQNRPILEKVLEYPAETDYVANQFWAAQTRRVMGKLARAALFSGPVPGVEDASDYILSSLPGYPDSPDTYTEQYRHIVDQTEQLALRANALLDALRLGHPNDAENILKGCRERDKDALYRVTGELMAQGMIHSRSAAFVNRVIAEQKAAELSTRAQQAEARPKASIQKGRSL